MGSAKSYALNLLKRRLRSAWEIDQALLRKGVEPEERAEIIAELTEVNLINDERFALSWIHTRDRLSPRGKYVLEQELMQRGIDKATTRLVMEMRNQEVEDDPELNQDQDQQIRTLIEKRQRLYANLPEEVRNRRLMSFLARRGFPLDRVRRILNA